jgi:Ca2+-binding RTX toxin-like protein
VENLTYTGATTFTGTGNSLNNEITGGIGNDTLDGGAGADTLDGGLGNDTYVVDDSGDVIVENSGAGIDTVKTAFGVYTLTAEVDKLLYTGASNFAGAGNAIANGITGGIGNDTLDGAAGADTLTGGTGDDFYIADASDSVVEKLGGGIDTVSTAASTYTLGAQLENLVYTGSGNFTGTGNTLANVITSGSGNDTINGGSGNDTINAGAGADVLTGSGGNDVFVFSAGEANGDTVSDFAVGKDHLQFAGFGAGSTFTQANTTDWLITDGIDHHTETIHFTNHPALHAADYTFL